MKHYNQIIVNLRIKDDTEDEKIEELCKEIEKAVDEKVEQVDFAEKDSIRIN